MKADDLPESVPTGIGARSCRLALLTMLAAAVGGCPTPIPSCVDTRTYLPAIRIADPGKSRSESVVVGRLVLDHPAGGDPMSVALARLDGDTVVAAIDLPLAPDGRFVWGLERGSYVITRVDRFSDYAKGQYGTKASFYPHLRFEAKGTRYVGQAVALTEPALDDMLPAHLFGPGTPRQGKLGVRGITVSDALGSEREQASHPAALDRPDLATDLMRSAPVEVYPVRTREECSRWKYWRLCVLPWACT